MRTAFCSAESEALSQRRALWSAKNGAKNHGKVSILPTFLFHSYCELLLRSNEWHNYFTNVSKLQYIATLNPTKCCHK